MLSGTEGILTDTPENVLVLQDEDAVLNCSTSSTPSTDYNPITWNYDNDIISYVPCTSQHPGFEASPPDSATDCNIRGLSSWEHGISGVYRCQTGYGRANRAVATVIVLGEWHECIAAFIHVTRGQCDLRLPSQLLEIVAFRPVQIIRIVYTNSANYKLTVSAGRQKLA